MRKFKRRLRELGTILKRTFNEWSAKDPFRQSAIIAYYSVFALPALLVIIINSAGLIFEREAIRGEITGEIGAMIGMDTAKQVESMIRQVNQDKDSLWSTILSIVVLLFGATSVFVQLQKSLNVIWEVQPAPKRKILKFLKDRLFSFGLIISIGFLLLVSLVISSVLAAFSGWIGNRFPSITPYLLQVSDFVVSFGIVSLLFALMFRFLPDAKIQWKDVWIGAMVTTFLFVIGKFALGLYFGKSDPASAYGAAGSIVLILLWVSYSCMILFFGAEFTKQFADAYGAEIKPTEYAIPRTPEKDCQH
jgi:membrane protein